MPQNEIILRYGAKMWRIFIENLQTLDEIWSRTNLGDYGWDDDDMSVGKCKNTVIIISRRVFFVIIDDPSYNVNKICHKTGNYAFENNCVAFQNIFFVDVHGIRLGDNWNGFQKRIIFLYATNVYLENDRKRITSLRRWTRCWMGIV